MQEVELDTKIKLIDCPGIVFTHAKSADQTSANVLRNAQRVTDIKDPFTIAETILQRASKTYFCNLYDITDYETSEEFFAKKALRMGKNVVIFKLLNQFLYYFYLNRLSFLG